MAGVTFFHLKNMDQINFFNAKIGVLKSYFSQNFGRYFSSIDYVFPDKKTCLILFDVSDDRFYKENNGNWLAFEGNVFSLSKTKKYTASELWGLYKEKGPGFVNELDGHFVIKLFDSDLQSYVVLTNFIRNRQNYICETDDYLMITPFIISTGVIKKPELDFNAVNELMWRYYILSERTILKDIKRLPPASIISFKDGHLDQKTYWHFPKQVVEDDINKLTDRLYDGILETARLIGENFSKVVSDLTLGQDSRIIVAAFKSQNIPIVTTTFGKENFLESKGVQDFSKRNDIINYPIHLSDDYTNNIWDHFEKAILLGNCDEPGYLLGRILHMREQQSQYGNAIINGAGGPFYKDCFWEEIYIFNRYRESQQVNLDQFLKLRPMNKNYTDFFFSDSFLLVKQKSSEYFIHMLEQAVKGYENCPVSMQIDKFALTQWQNYTVFANSVANSLYNGFSPLLFRRNLDISLPIPAKYRWNKSDLQRRIMYRLSPSMAKEKTDFGGINMVPKNLLTFIPFYFRYGFKQSERFRNKIKNKLGLNPKTWLQEAWDYKPIYQKLYMQEEHQSLIQSRMYIDSILKPTKWSDFVNSFNDSDGVININQYEMLFKISGIELLMRHTEKLT